MFNSPGDEDRCRNHPGRHSAQEWSPADQRDPEHEYRRGWHRPAADRVENVRRTALSGASGEPAGGTAHRVVGDVHTVDR
jgi:hypothetical protein